MRVRFVGGPFDGLNFEAGEEFAGVRRCRRVTDQGATLAVYERDEDARDLFTFKGYVANEPRAVPPLPVSNQRPA